MSVENQSMGNILYNFAFLSPLSTGFGIVAKSKFFGGPGGQIVPPLPPFIQMRFFNKNPRFSHQINTLFNGFVTF
jgi:hypothetical protein